MKNVIEVNGVRVTIESVEPQQMQEVPVRQGSVGAGIPVQVDLERMYGPNFQATYQRLQASYNQVQSDLLRSQSEVFNCRQQIRKGNDSLERANQEVVGLRKSLAQQEKEHRAQREQLIKAHDEVAAELEAAKVQVEECKQQLLQMKELEKQVKEAVEKSTDNPAWDQLNRNAAAVEELRKELSRKSMDLIMCQRRITDMEKANTDVCSTHMSQNVRILHLVASWCRFPGKPLEVYLNTDVKLSAVQFLVKVSMDETYMEILAVPRIRYEHVVGNYSVYMVNLATNGVVRLQAVKPKRVFNGTRCPIYTDGVAFASISDASKATGKTNVQLGDEAEDLDCMTTFWLHSNRV